MKTSELIERLHLLRAKHGDINVMILDTGTPRDINLGPVLRLISLVDSALTVDCENREGEPCVMVGFGNY